MASYEEPTWGLVSPKELEQIVVISPHFDDAVMGAGDLLGSYSSTTVLTVFAGTPTTYPQVLSEWDRCAGFKPGDDVVAARRDEDLAALRVLDSDHRWLEFIEHQYLAPEERPSTSDIAPVLSSAIKDLGPTAVFVPMGLGNPDHVTAHDAALIVRESFRDIAWFCYEDHGYKHIPGLLAWRVAKLLRSGPWATPAIVPITPDPVRKREAIWSYTSQIPPLEQDHALSARMDANVPEQFWRLAPPPKGWEGLADLI